MQHFKIGMVVDYASASEVAEHFEPADGSKPEAAAKKGVSTRKKEAAVK